MNWQFQVTDIHLPEDGGELYLCQGLLLWGSMPLKLGQAFLFPQFPEWSALNDPSSVKRWNIWVRVGEGRRAVHSTKSIWPKSQWSPWPSSIWVSFIGKIKICLYCRFFFSFFPQKRIAIWNGTLASLGLSSSHPIGGYIKSAAIILKPVFDTNPKSLNCHQ